MNTNYYRWVSTKEESPESQSLDTFNNKNFLLKTRKYGEMLGFYSDGTWYSDYSCIIADPVEFWLKEFDPNEKTKWKDCLKNAKENATQAIDKGWGEDPKNTAFLHTSISNVIEDLEEIIEIIEDHDKRRKN